MGRFRLRLLGWASLVDPGGEIVPLRPKQLSLLAYLALEWGQVHPRRLVAELLWPDRDPSKARNNLRLALFKIREAVGEVDWLTADRTGISVLPDAGLDVDVADLLAGTLPTDAHQPLADLAPHDTSPDLHQWATTWSQRVRIATVSSLTSTAATALAAGDPTTAEHTARRLLDIDTLVESGHALLIRALLAQDRHPEAIQHTDHCRQLLHDELGITPSPELLALTQTSSPSLAQIDDDVPLDVTGPPVLLTSFVGRTHEVTHLTDKVRSRSSRLLSIIGPGGMGKTRLAIEIAATCGRTFDEGAAFASLEGLHTPAEVPAALADALGLPGIGTAPDPAAALTTRLADREVLLVADNLEHLQADPGDGQAHAPGEPASKGGGVATLLANLVASCPYVVVVATSRRTLRIQGEDRLVLEGLAHPAIHEPADTDPAALGRHDAVRLLMDRIHHIDKRLRLDHNTAIPIAQITAATEGMPLGLELAAAAVRSTTLEQIAATLTTAPATLEADLVDVPARHADLGAVYRHSIGLLRPSDQTAMRRLSVFRGGFTPDSALAVARADAPTLARLSSASLLHRQASGRYRIHELIRQLAEHDLDQSGDGADARTTHAHQHITLLAEAGPQMKRAGAPEAHSRIQADAANIRSAWRHLVSTGDAASVVPAARGLVLWTDRVGGVPDALGLLEEAQAVADTDHDRATLLMAQGSLASAELDAANVVGLLDRAEAFARRATGSTDLLIEIILARGWSLLLQAGDVDGAEEALQRLRTTIDGTEDRDLLGQEQAMSGTIASFRGDARAAMPMLRAAADLHAATGNLVQLYDAHAAADATLASVGEIGPSYESSTAARDVALALGNELWSSAMEMTRSVMLIQLGQYEEAIPPYERRIALRRRAGLGPMFMELAGIGRALDGLGRTEEAEASFAAGVADLQAFPGHYLSRYILPPWSRFLRRRNRHLEADLVAGDYLGTLLPTGNAAAIASVRVLRARALLGLEHRDDALEQVEQAWRLIGDEDGVRLLQDPLETMLECHDVFLAGGCAAEATGALRLARLRLREVAAGIADPRLRASYLRTPVVVAVQDGQSLG